MDGILIVDKPQGMTSHDVVDFIRKRFSLEKVGHAGTLDPMATGVLVMLIGKYTKSSGQLMCDDKEYHAEMTLGMTSDTGDAWGKISYSDVPADLTEDDIRSAFKKFLGPISQTPPIYSAIKHKGKKLYELARKGISVEIAPRSIFIGELDIVKIGLPKISFKVTCSKGTYIRQLSSDIGAALGCGACLSELRRTRSGRFRVDDAINIEELKNITHLDMERLLLS